jgi:hypothetical protein
MMMHGFTPRRAARALLARSAWAGRVLAAAMPAAAVHALSGGPRPAHSVPALAMLGGGALLSHLPRWPLWMSLDLDLLALGLVLVAAGIHGLRRGRPQRG